MSIFHISCLIQHAMPQEQRLPPLSAMPFSSTCHNLLFALVMPKYMKTTLSDPEHQQKPPQS